MNPRVRREEGVSTVELAVLLPLFLVLLTVAVPLVKAGWEYLTVSRAAAHGVRYATRVEVNARESAVGLTRRPTAEEVDAFVRDAARPLELDAVRVSPEPVSSLPGEQIRLEADYEISFGPLADLANGVKGLFFGGGAFLPQSTVVTVSAEGREE